MNMFEESGGNCMALFGNNEKGEGAILVSFPILVF